MREGNTPPSAPQPPARGDPPPGGGVALPLGGQRPISLEYQIYYPAIDTIVIGMVLHSRRGSANDYGVP